MTAYNIAMLVCGRWIIWVSKGAVKCCVYGDRAISGKRMRDIIGLGKEVALLLLRLTPRALEGDPKSTSTFSGSVERTASGGERLPKVRCRRTSRFGHLWSQLFSVCGSVGT